MQLNATIYNYTKRPFGFSQISNFSLRKNRIQTITNILEIKLAISV